MIDCREHHRIPVDLHVFFSTIGNTNIRQGSMFDISEGGCAVTSTHAVQPGTGMILMIDATDLAVPITIHSAAVRWASHGEFGVEFLELTDLDRNRLHRFLHVATLRSAPHN